MWPELAPKLEGVANGLCGSVEDLRATELYLSGGGIRLVPLAERHATEIVECVDAEMWAGFLSSQPDSVQKAVEYVREAQESRYRLPLAVEDEATGQFLGSTSFYELQSSQGRVEIGHTFYRRDRWGTTLNPTCKLVMLEHVFDTLRLHRVAFRCDIRNTRSARAIGRVGARQEGILRGHRLAADGARSDTLLFSILATEWPMVRAQLQERLHQVPEQHD